MRTTTIGKLKEIINDFPEDTPIYFSVVNDRDEPFTIDCIEGNGSDEKITITCYPGEEYFDSMKFIDLDAIVGEITNEIAVSVKQILNNKLGET